jgi:class 3 adenylate cyclase
MTKFRRFLSELWRRHVLQIAIPYGVIGWLIVQVLELVLDVYDAPPWIMQTVLVVLVVGFPVAILLAWLFDISPKGNILLTQPLPAPLREQEPVATEQPEFVPAPALALEMGDAERRQVTVLHCRLHALGQVMEDPEFVQQALRSLERIYADIIKRFDGYRVASGPHELILVFGYPVTFQGEARYAIAAGLALIAELRRAPELDDAAGATAFDICVGVATGLVVVEDRDGSGKDARFIGLAPGIAAWLQGLAEPGALLIEPQTRKLAGNNYRAESLGVFESHEFGGKSEVFAVTEAVSDDLRVADQNPVVGRDVDLAQLQDGWDSVLDGEGRYILVRGDGGLGKSSLLRAFVRQVYDARQHVYHAQCAYQDRHTPFAPIIHLMRRQVLHYSDSDSDQQRLEKLEHYASTLDMPATASIPLLARMLSVPHESLAGFAGDSPQSLRGRTIELVLDILTESARRTPMLLAIEDLLWADASTLELIGQVMNRGPIPGLCLLFTARPDFDAEWMRRSFVVAIDMKPLNRRRARALIEQTAGIHQLPTELCDRIIEETGGIPLYVQELTRAVLESGQWQQHVSDGGEFDLARLKIPANLQESIAARLDNLGPAKPVMQLCSVLGREFSYDLLRDASGTENETALREALDTIVEAELLFQHGMANHRSYIFKHVFIQEVAYDTLLKTQRRQLHARVAEMLEQKETESAQERALWLAHHHTEAGNVAQAVHNWLLASGESLNEFANIEAAAQARRGIELLEAQPPSAERSAMIIPLQTTLGTALLAMFGYAHDDVRAAFSRALALCEDIGDSPETFRVLVGMWMYYFVAGNFDEAQKLGDRMLGISTASGEPGQDMQARYCVALVLFYRGQFDAARGHFQAAIDNERADCAGPPVGLPLHLARDAEGI